MEKKNNKKPEKLSGQKSANSSNKNYNRKMAMKLATKK